MPALSIKTILIPVDFSAKAEDAVRYAASLARRFNSEVILLHVLEPPHLDFAMVELPGSLESMAQAGRERARARLEQFATADFEGIRVTRKVAQGQPSDEILAAAEKADLVVMPTQGHGRLREFLIGSVTAKVLHDCHRPVLTGIHLETDASRQAAEAWRAGRALCAIDFGPESENVLDWGAHLAGELGSQIIALHVGSAPDAAERLARAVNKAGLKAATMVIPGEAHAVITATAQKDGADLVVIGRGSTPGALGRLRAQAYEIVRKSPCPVLSV